ncbi:MAG: 4Fe-4S binding protein, partial [bacterium]
PYHNIEGVSVPDPLIYTNLGNLLFWIYWMMGMIILVLIWGRKWCAICPIGAINGITGKFGLKLNYPEKLRNWYLLAVIFIILQIVINTFQLNHYPDLTARLIFIFILAGAILGLLFRDRVFCRYLCPVGSMLGIYSCFSPLELRVKDKKICSQCLNKECIKGKTNSYSLCLGKNEFPLRNDAVPCPAQLFPAVLESNTHCFLCAQCVKNCPNDNIRYGTRNIFKEIFQPNERPFSETLFIILLLGMILEKFVPLWPNLQEKIFPESLPTLIFYLWIYLILPGIIVLLPSFLIYFISQIKIKNAGETNQTDEPIFLKKIIAYESNIFIPFIFFSHFALAVVKISMRGGYLFNGIIDPVGIKTYRAVYLAEILNPVSGIFPILILRWLALFPIILGSVISLIAVFKINKSKLSGKNLSAFTIINSGTILIIGLVFVLIVRNWLFS